MPPHFPTSSHSRRLVTALGLAALLVVAGGGSLALARQGPPSRPATAARPATPATTSSPFTVEYYYRVRWGHQDEFLRLFKKNHVPILQRQVELGYMTSYTAVEPFYHAADQSRWDYRVTIVYPSAAVAHAPDPGSDPAFRRALFPDTATFAAEERRRFELLEAHWDVPVVPLPLR